MTNKRKDLKNKVAVVGLGDNNITHGIIARLIQKDAIVIALAQRSRQVYALHQYLIECELPMPASLLTDFPDYEKARELAEMIVEQY